MSETTVFVAIRDYGSDGLKDPIFVFADEDLANAFMLGRDMDSFKIFPCKLIKRDVIQHRSPADWKDEDDPQSASLSVRTSNILKQMELKTVGAVRRSSDDELLANPITGRKSLRELRDVFGAHRSQEKTATD